MEPKIVIGDIHGDIRQLRLLTNEVANWKRPLVFLGDYVNRGDYSKEVIEWLLQIEKATKNVYFLCGNHDWSLLQYIEHGSFNHLALIGGLATLNSYIPEGTSGNLHQAILSYMPRSHIEFLKRLRPYFEDDDTICSHAGVPLNRPAERSFEELVLGSHPELFKMPWDENKLNVFGHYPQTSLQPFQGNTICLDTGCGTLEHGRLTALILPERKFLQSDQLDKID